MDDIVPDDGFKWFGEGFDGFPKRLPDDCVEYIIYLVDEKLTSLAATRNRLNEILRAANGLQKRLLNDYIWQREGFELNLHPKFDPSNKHPAPPHLRGRTNFGDSIVDEWLVTYLLRELSTSFPDAWMRVYDSDGEFLLIEAAKSLPIWLNPDIAENRVWINDGHLKILPPKDGSLSRNLSIQGALKTIQAAPQSLLVDPAVEQEAFHRLREYPSAISSSLHHALITIPRRLAYILHRNPAYISPAVEAFYLRDPIGVKPLATKDLATLNFPPEDFVTVSVKFTKVGYAQLRSQVFDAPPAWTGIIPRLKDDKVSMGMKLTCGFEIMIADQQSQNSRAVQEIKLLLEDLESGDDRLPSDAELGTWPNLQDDEKWLDIDYNDFEKELDGKGKTRDGVAEHGPQENLRNMVSRFRDFLDDDEAGAEGVDDADEDDKSDNSYGESDTAGSGREDGQADADAAEFEKAMKEANAMPRSQLEESGLLEEARRLALQDDANASDVDEDEEMRQVMELMEKELKGHGALDINGKGKAKSKSQATAASNKPIFGPERPPHLQDQSLAKKSVRFEGTADSADEEIGPGDGELSSDDEDFNDVDLGLAKNMLESFKGQVGMAGPAGNMMRALGVGMPRDEDSD